MNGLQPAAEAMRTLDARSILALHAWRARQHQRRARSRVAPYVLLGLVWAASALTIALTAAPLRDVIAPLAAVLCLAATYLAVLYARDGQMPFFEIATYWVLAMSLYGTFPLINYIAGGLQWTSLSISRLVTLNPGPAEVAAMGWRSALYILAFVVVYLTVRGRRHVDATIRVDPPGYQRVVAMMLSIIVISAVMFLIAHIYGVVFYASYEDKYSGEAVWFSKLPHAVGQVIHNAVGIRQFLVQMLIVVALQNWHRTGARVALIAFLMLFGTFSMVMQGQRTELVIYMLSAAVLFHRLVRPVSPRAGLMGGVVLLGLFLGMGLVRDFDGAVAESGGIGSMLSAANEFQAVWATGYHLLHLRETGELGDVPTQIHFTEFVLLVPSQLLPFRKWNPSHWYLEVSGLGTAGTGYMFGALAQAIVGWDWIEIAVRGVLMGIFCAMVQRWYANRPSSFWRTVFTLFVIVFMYYSARQASFAVLYFVFYRFIPTLVLLEITRSLLSASAKRLRGRRSTRLAELRGG